MKNYPAEDKESTRSQNPGPLDIAELGGTPLKKDDDRSDQVIHLQKILFELGYLLGLGSTILGTRTIDGVDGIFGGDTDVAVRQFQRDHQDFEGQPLVQDGIVGERTGDSLNREMVGIWYASYASLDKDGDPAPADLPLITLDPDSNLSLNVPFDGDVKKVHVVVHGNGSPPDITTDRSVNYIPNDPVSAGSSAPDPVPRFLAKEAHLMHLHSANQVPVWAIRFNGDSSKPAGGGGAFTPTNPNTPFPLPGRDPSDPPLPDTNGYPGFGGGGQQFQEAQVHVCLARTVRTWLSLGFRFSNWQVPGALGITVRDAATNLNGFYSRKLGGLFLGTVPTANSPFFAADSADLVSHEAGHAILDSIAPNLLSAASLETQSFHEAFGDISAILTTLSDADVREEMLTRADDLEQSTIVSKVMEDLGTQLFAGNNGSLVAEANTLREAFKENPEDNPFPGFGAPDRFPFNYNDPSGGPPPPTFPLSQAAIDSGQNFSNTVTSEFHDFGRVFVMAFYDALANAYNRLKTKHGSGQDEQDLALREAAGCLGKILAKAIIRQPNSTGRYYQRVAREMFRVDSQSFNKEFRDDLRGDPVPGNGFVGRNIVTDDDIK